MQEKILILDVSFDWECLHSLFSLRHIHKGMRVTGSAVGNTGVASYPISAHSMHAHKVQNTCRGWSDELFGLRIAFMQCDLV